MDLHLKEAMTKMFDRHEDDAPDALTLIHNDHVEVSALFETALGEKTTPAVRRNTALQICEALTVHAKMEEAIFYPALRRAGKTEEKDSVLEAAEEHGLVKDLIAKIKRTETRDETMKAKLTVLKEIVEHHVREEESTMFGEARRVLGKKLQALGEEMQAFKNRANKTGKKAPAKKSSARGAAVAGRKSSPRKAAARKTARKTGTRR